jgi:hypothetical protein
MLLGGILSSLKVDGFRNCFTSSRPPLLRIFSSSARGKRNEGIHLGVRLKQGRPQGEDSVQWRSTTPYDLDWAIPVHELLVAIKDR